MTAQSLQTRIARAGLGIMALTLLAATLLPASGATAARAPAIAIKPASHNQFIMAQVTTQAPVRSVHLHVDSKQVRPAIDWHSTRQMTVRYALQPLALGTHVARLTVWDTSGRTVQREWKVYKLEPLGLQADHTAIRPGDTVTLSGRGFIPGHRIWISLGDAHSAAGGEYGTALVGSQGRFTLPVTLADYPDGSRLAPGAVTLVAHTKSFKYTAAVQLRVLAAEAPAIEVNRTEIRPGDTVALFGTGFTPGATITVSMGGITTGTSGNYGTTAADAQGLISLDVTLSRYPDGSPLRPGTIVLLAHNADGSETATTRVQVLTTPSLSLDKEAIRAGETVTIHGEGFSSNQAVSIALGDVNTDTGGNYGNAVTDALGAFTVQVAPGRYPDGTALRPGAVVLLAHNRDGSEKATAQLTIRANPVLTVSKTLIEVGETITLNGEGFTPNKTVTIGLAGIDTGHGNRYGSVAADANGRFSFGLTLARYPDGTPLPPGGITLMALTSDGEQALANLQILATPAISLDKSSIRPGDHILVTGQGFTPGASISISMGPVNGSTGGNYGNATADTNGRFSLTVAPALYPDGSTLRDGPIVFLAHTPDFSQKATAQVLVDVPAAITLSRTAVKPGERVTVTGEGFPAGSPVLISLGMPGTEAGGNYGSTIADSNGRIRLDITPDRFPDGTPLRPGTVVVVAQLPSYEEKAAAQLQIVAQPAIAVNRSSIRPGDDVVVTGEGFIPGSVISISLGSSNTGAGGTYGTATAGAGGRFILNVRLERYPNGTVLQPGSIVLVAHDSSWTQCASVQLQVLQPPLATPAPPSDLRAVVVKAATSSEPSYVNLQWRDNAINESGYRVHAIITRAFGSTESRTQDVAAGSTGAQLSFVAGGINPIIRVCYTVTAINAYGESAPSNQVCLDL